MGIDFEDFSLNPQGIIDECFVLGDEKGGYDEDSDESMDKEDDGVRKCLKFIVISQHNPIYTLWSGFNVFCCLTSCYFYAYMAAFENPKYGDPKWSVFGGLELVFLISFLLNFIVDYYPDGSMTPVDEIPKIAQRYFETRFWYDFIPLIPL